MTLASTNAKVWVNTSSWPTARRNVRASSLTSEEAEEEGWIFFSVAEGVGSTKGYRLEGAIVVVVVVVVDVVGGRDRLLLAKAAALSSRSSCLLYTSPSPRDLSTSRMPSSA